MAPRFSEAVYFCYKRCDITSYRALKVLNLVCFDLTHPNLSPRLVYVNASSLESSYEFDSDRDLSGFVNHLIQIVILERVRESLDSDRDFRAGL